MFKNMTKYVPWLLYQYRVSGKWLTAHYAMRAAELQCEGQLTFGYKNHI